jgi:hypothetical protein
MPLPPDPGLVAAACNRINCFSRLPWPVATVVVVTVLPSA